MTTPVTAGRYHLHARIGQGATGVVYEATDPDRGSPLAVKVMLPEVAQDAECRQHFLREARAVARLRHRHLAAVYDVAGSEDTPFVAMERLRGRTLAERLTMPPAPTLAESLEIVEQLCLGLQFAHEHGLVHRNVTPANIWLLEDGSVKLADFGLPPASAPTVTDSRPLVRRVAYLAPEQIAAKDVDGRTDLFAAGVVLFELVTGRRPFEADSITGIFDKVLNESADPVLALLPAEAERVDAVLRRALAKDPSRRYPDALEMAADLTLARLELIAGAKAIVTADEPAAVERYEPEEPADLVYQAHARADAAGPRVMDLPAETWASSPLLHGPGSAAPDAWQGGDTTGYDLPAPTLFGRFRSAVEAQNPIVLVAGSGAVTLAILLGVWLALRTPTRPSTAGANAPAATRTTPTPASAAIAQMRIESNPDDAEVFVNGASLGSKTPLAIPVDRLRNAELRLVKPGFDPLTVRVSSEDLAKQTLAFTLVAEAPSIVVSGTAPFAFEVLSGRTVVSRANTSHRFTIRGAQTLRVRAPDYFLDRAVAIPVGKSAVALFVPPLGRLSVRVSPALERCRVSIGGRDFGTPPYAPVPYQSIVAGAHRVELTCPDGAVHQQSITVEADRDRAAVFR